MTAPTALGAQPATTPGRWAVTLISVWVTATSFLFVSGVAFLIPSLASARRMSLFAPALLDHRASAGAVSLMIAVSMIALLDNGLKATVITEFAGPTCSGRSLGLQSTAQRLMAAAEIHELKGSKAVSRHIDAAQLPTATNASPSGGRTEHLTPLADKPRLRGWIHVYCAAAALVAGSALVTVSWAVASRLAGHATLAYTLAIVSMFGVSATYHRVHWGSDVARAWMRRLDHSMIYIFIAGTYTPFARLDMPRHTGHVVLGIVWGAALAGVALTLFWPAAPRWLSVTLYLLLGWVGVWYTGLILHNAGVAAIVLLGVGGVLYSLGAIVYALRRPDPWPSTFGYHEVFHACTAIAAICHFVAVCLAVF